MPVRPRLSTYQYNPVKTTKTNVMGTINMLGLAKRVRARMLLTSTSEVYGDPEEHPQKESYWGHVNPIGIRSCYDEGKRVAECLMMDYHRQNKVDTKIVRIFNTYGPRMAIDDGRVVSNFCVAALRGEDLTVYGEGKQTRSFAYIDDLVEGLVRMMDAPDFIGPVNLGNPDEIHQRWSWRRWRSSCPKARPDWCSGRCRQTIRRGAARISAWRVSALDGNPKSRYAKA